MHSGLELGMFFRRSYFCLRSRHLEVVGPRKTGEGRGLNGIIKVQVSEVTSIYFNGTMWL